MNKSIDDIFLKNNISLDQAVKWFSPGCILPFKFISIDMNLPKEERKKLWDKSEPVYGIVVEAILLDDWPHFKVVIDPIHTDAKEYLGYLTLDYFFVWRFFADKNIFDAIPEWYLKQLKDSYDIYDNDDTHIIAYKQLYFLTLKNDQPRKIYLTDYFKNKN